MQKPQGGNGVHKEPFMVILGSLDSVNQNTLLWRLYYRIFGLPHFGNHVRFGYVRKALSLSNQESALDLGCGDGTLLNLLAANYGCKGVGVDRLANRISKAKTVKEHFGLSEVNYHVSDITDYLNSVLGRETYDKIFLLEVLEHIKSPEDVLRLATKMLNREGQIIVTVPTLAEGSGRIVRKAEFDYGKDEHQIGGFSLQELKELARGENLKIRAMVPTFGPFKQALWAFSEQFRNSKFLYSMLVPILRSVAKIEQNVSLSKTFGIFVVLTKG